MVAIGWYAYREYDQCWCYDVNGTMGWYKEKPEGGVLHLYGNGCKVAETDRLERSYIFMRNG